MIPPKIRVERHPLQSTTQPWLVRCRFCGPATDFPSNLFGDDQGVVKGWAKDWRMAQDWAARHAIEHEKTRCPTCLHVPEQDISAARADA